MNENLMNEFFSPNITSRERATFEVGIKLGALYHILCGIPISSDPKTIKAIEKGIEAAISSQPFVEEVILKLYVNKIRGSKENPFDYDEIRGEIIQATVILKFQSIKVIGKIKWVEENRYPLMYISDIIEES